jgi:hypothetical protein
VSRRLATGVPVHVHTENCDANGPFEVLQNWPL